MLKQYKTTIYIVVIKANRLCITLMLMCHIILKFSMTKSSCTFVFHIHVIPTSLLQKHLNFMNDALFLRKPARNLS